MHGRSRGDEEGERERVTTGDKSDSNLSLGTLWSSIGILSTLL